MKARRHVFPGSNCDRDVAGRVEAATGAPPLMVWHRPDTELPAVDLIVLPGGFSYGDYLRCGAMAAAFAGDARRSRTAPPPAGRCWNISI